MPEPGLEGLSEEPVRQKVAGDWEAGWRGWDATDTLSHPSLSLLFRRIFLGIKIKDSKRLNQNLDFAKGKINLEWTKCPLLSCAGKLKSILSSIKPSSLVQYKRVVLFVNASHPFEARHSSFTHFREPDVIHLLSLGYMLLSNTAGVDLLPRWAPQASSSLSHS